MMGLDPGPLVRALENPLVVLGIRWWCKWCKLWNFCSNWNWVNLWHCSVGPACTKRSRVQRWLTRRIILALKILIFSPSFKISFRAIILLWPRPDHSIRCNFTNKITRRDTVGFIDKASDSGSRDAEGPKFIRCMDGHEPHFHEVWTFGEDGVTSGVHPTTQVDVGAGFFGELVTDFLTESWRRVPMFFRNSINIIVEWLGIPEFLRTDGPAWTANLLDPHPSWGDKGSRTNPNLGNQFGGASIGVSIWWNRPVRVLPVYHRRIS